MRRSGAAGSSGTHQEVAEGGSAVNKEVSIVAPMQVLKDTAHRDDADSQIYLDANAPESKTPLLCRTVPSRKQYLFRVGSRSIPNQKGEGSLCYSSSKSEFYHIPIIRYSAQHRRHHSRQELEP